MRMFNKLTCRLLACLLFFNCLPALLSAQGTQAIITGTVVDNKGESVIGATIQVKNESTDSSRALSRTIKENTPSSSFR